MNIAELFDTLTPPETSNRNLFNTATLQEFSFVKMGISNDGFPVILISSLADTTSFSQKNVRLKYLELIHNIECKISEEGNKLCKFHSNYIQKQSILFAVLFFKNC